jgi:hypothetical protein
MAYQPRNRNVRSQQAFSVGPDEVPFYVDDIDSRGGPIAWGREGNPIRVVTYYGGRFTLCDDRGRYLKRERAQRGEYRRRVRTFGTAPAAALFAVENAVESCE